MVAADGRIVRGLAVARPAPTVRSPALPTGDRISDQVSFAALELLDVAPPALRARVATGSRSAPTG